LRRGKDLPACVLDPIQKSPKLSPRLRALSIVVLLSTFCLTHPPTQAQSADAELPASTIRGTVINNVTHEPIGRALVVSTDNRFAIRTDDEGHFEFTIPRPEANLGRSSSAQGTASFTAVADWMGSFPSRLMARKPGFLPGRNSTVNLQMGAPDQEVTIALTPEAMIVGRVAFPTSDTSDRINVEVYQRRVQNGRAHWQPAATVATRSNGVFRFAELAAGTYKLFTHESLDRDPISFTSGSQLFGYAPIYYPTASDFAAAGTIILTAGQTFQAELSPVRQPYYPIKIPVKNADAGAPIEVRVLMQGHRGPGYSLGYNPQEQSIQGLLPNGTYTIEASSSAPGSATGYLNITVKGGPVEGATLALLPNGNMSVKVKQEFTATENREQDATSPPPIIVSGSGLGLRGGTAVTFEGGALSARRLLSNVMLEPADDFGPQGGNGLRPPLSPQDDSLIIENVLPGRYRVRVDPARGYVSALTSGGVDLLKHPIVVASGGSTPAIEVTLRDDTAQIDGTVEDAATKVLAAGLTNSAAPAFGRSVSYDPAAYVYCVPLPDSPARYTEISVSAEGKFTYSLPPGAYRVLAFRHPQLDLEYHNAEAMRAYDSMGQVVRLVGGQRESLQLQLISTEH
jgi:hypothetical protein